MMVEYSEKIDDNFLSKIKNSGHSRFPVYKDNKDNVIGILYLRQLLGNRSIGKTIGEIADKNVLFIDENKKLDVALRAFLRTHHHLFVVHDEFNAISGVITLENILEEIIRDVIVDEADVYKDLRKIAKQSHKRKGEIS